jgi:transcription termination factor Rho
MATRKPRRKSADAEPETKRKAKRTAKKAATGSAGRARKKSADAKPAARPKRKAPAAKRPRARAAVREETAAKVEAHDEATPRADESAQPAQEVLAFGDERDGAEAPVLPPAIPPLPDEDEDEFVPFEDEATAEPAREAPPGATPAEILEAVRGGELHVSALGDLDDEAVNALAAEAGITVGPRARREDVLYRLLQEPGRAVHEEVAFVEGLLELHPDGYGFLRRPDHDYAQHPEDVYVAAGLVRRLGLKPGLWISGTARRRGPRERFMALEAVEEVNHEDPSRLQALVPFEELTVVYPDTRFLLEVAKDDYEMRVMDLFCPLGQGQRALIVSPPRAGKTVLLQKLSDAIAHNSPNVDIVVLLLDERPEEVTNMRRSVRGEVIASTFDRPASNHVRVAELVMEKVKRMVEFGHNVVLLLDSITRMGRAYNNQAGPSGRILTGGLDAKALTKPKRFFGAARNVENGGSLTIVATALVDTGSRLDDVIFEEFKGTGNMEVVLDRSLANARVWPAINLPASGTRNEELLLHPEELRRINMLRKTLGGVDPPTAMTTIKDMMNQYKTNAELLMSLA